MRKNGRIVSLAGEKIAITGYLRQERRRVVAEIEQKRAQYQRNVNRATTVLVQGSPHQSYKLERSSGERYGMKIAAAERARACGQPIAVITEAELRILLRGSGLSRRQTAASDGGPLSELGVPHRHGRRAGIREGTITVVDSGDLDRATAFTIALSIASPMLFRRKAGLLWTRRFRRRRTISAGSVPSEIWVAEVKTISAKNEITQVRHGLGQVLHYAAVLQRMGKGRVRPALIMDHQVDNADLRRACDGAGVVLASIKSLSALHL